MLAFLSQSSSLFCQCQSTPLLSHVVAVQLVPFFISFSCELEGQAAPVFLPSKKVVRFPFQSYAGPLCCMHERKEIMASSYTTSSAQLPPLHLSLSYLINRSSVSEGKTRLTETPAGLEEKRRKPKEGDHRPFLYLPQRNKQVEEAEAMMQGWPWL